MHKTLLANNYSGFSRQHSHEGKLIPAPRLAEGITTYSVQAHIHKQTQCMFNADAKTDI